MMSCGDARRERRRDRQHGPDGRIETVASVAGYLSSKHGVIGVTKSARSTLHRRVCAMRISPAGIAL
jgi:hypothetical protein